MQFIYLFLLLESFLSLLVASKQYQPVLLINVQHRALLHRIAKFPLIFASSARDFSIKSCKNSEVNRFVRRRPSTSRISLSLEKQGVKLKIWNPRKKKIEEVEVGERERELKDLDIVMILPQLTT